MDLFVNSGSSQGYFVFPPNQLKTKKQNKKLTFSQNIIHNKFVERSQAIKISLSEIQVRPIISDEMSQFKKLLSRYHYLGTPSMIGSTICYVATYRERWVSLLSFSSAALKCKARDQWIGWEPCFKWQRIHLLANNTRFLILPGYSQKNLASKVLSLCLKRISIDWETYFNHSLLLVETFVDPSRFHGTYYFASNWLLLGQTMGI